jgi:hypothetical protein
VTKRRRISPVDPGPPSRLAISPHGRDVAAHPDLEVPVAFEAIHVLPGFCTLVKRSPTLDGTLALRAAQHCSPVFEGNEAGFQVSLSQPMTLSRDGAGLHIDMTSPAFKQTQEEAPDCIERLVKQGLLERNGHWHRLLAADAVPSRGARIFLWSGFLVRPVPGVCLRVGAAFNRRSRISIVEHAIADSDRFTPLILEIDARRLGPSPTYVTDEIGCVLPVAAQARLQLASIRRAPGVVRAFESFFDAHYFETKRSKPTGKYRRLVRESPDAEDAADCDAQVFTAGPAVHTVSTMDRFFGPGGISKQAPPGVALPQGTVTNVAHLEATWDGQTFTHERKEMAAALRSLARDWRAAGGSSSGDGFEFLSGYMFGPGRDEPYWLLQPWVFAVTPPGWSTVADGVDVGGCDGMRGILRTDQFHSLAMVYRMYAPGRIAVRAGAPLIRFFPIPRRLQGAALRLVTEVI